MYALAANVSAAQIIQIHKPRFQNGSNRLLTCRSTCLPYQLPNELFILSLSSSLLHTDHDRDVFLFKPVSR
jgi:hypothetical protein